MPIVMDAGFGGTGTLACAVFAIVTAATNCLLEVAGDFKGAQANVPVLLKRAHKGQIGIGQKERENRRSKNPHP
jgi:hypothetical protein